MNEALSNTANPGVNIAGTLVQDRAMYSACVIESFLNDPFSTVTKCLLHYISYDKLKEVEETDPELVLTLYKLLASLMAKRQSITINQLATLHSIMGSQARKRPHGRAGQRDTLAAVYGSTS